MERDTIYLDEFRFAVLKNKATLHGLISNATDFRLYWMINIPCESADVLIDGHTHHYWQPKVYLESMTFDCRNWKELVGRHFASTPDDNYLPALYLYEHDDLEESDIHFIGRHGLLFDVDWKFGWSGKKGRVRTNVKFTEGHASVLSLRRDRLATSV